MPARTIEEFESFYRTRLTGRLEALDSERRTVSRKIYAGLVAGLAVGAVGLSIVFAQRLHPALALVPVVLVAIVTAVKVNAPYRAYVARYKEDILRAIVGFLGSHLEYRPQSGLAESEYTACGIFRRDADRYSCEDLVEGKVEDTALRFSEVHAEYKTETTDSKGNRTEHWHTIFRGILFCADFNKHFSGKTYVLTDVAERLFGFLGTKLQSVVGSHGQFVSLEDPEFEKSFAVYATDQVEARYILSPALMRRLLGYKLKASKDIQASFTGSKVYVAIPYSRDLFEPSLFRSLVDPEPIREYYDALTLALAIVDDLNLNNRIWTKV